MIWFIFINIFFIAIAIAIAITIGIAMITGENPIRCLHLNLAIYC